jgi:hypothetical protein
MVTEMADMDREIQSLPIAGETSVNKNEIILKYLFRIFY